MFTPTLNPNSSTSTSKNTNSINSQTHLELGKFLLTHDPIAIRLYDYINHVKVFLYNSNEFRWENNSYIEGNLFSYERRQITNNQAYPSYAFAIINQKQIFIQQITSDMSLHSDKLCLFYEITKNNKPEVFGLHFANENECQRLDAFVKRSIQSIRNFKEQSITTNELQSAQTAVNILNFIKPQMESSQQTQNSTEDQTLSLKRLLNIPSQHNSDTGSDVSSQQNPINLIPPSAFESISPSPIGAECSKHYLSPTINREQFRNVLLHLVQNNDQFYDMIHQTCITHPSQ